MRKLQYLFLFLILFVGFLVRLYRFDGPIADWHSWRQSDTEAVSKIYQDYGIDFLHPRYYDISKIQSGLENPLGYRFVEFPIYNIFQTGFYSVFAKFSLVEWGRLVSIFSSLLSAIFIFLLVKKYANRRAGLFSSFFFVFLPFSIFYSRAILPDEMMVMASLGGIYFFSRWGEVKFKILNFNWLIALLFTACAFLLKPYALFFVLPFVYIAWKENGLSFLKKWQLWFFLIASLIPLVFWRLWMLQFPEGIPFSTWLLNGGYIRFKGAFFNWIFAERISKLILGYFGVGLLFIGFIKQEKEKHYLFFISMLLSSLAYLVVVARGNVQHDYYQILIIPSLAVFLGRGADFLLSFKERSGKLVGIILITVVTLFSFAFSWFYIRDFFNINNRQMVEAGVVAQQLIPKDAKVIAPYKGDTTFLNNTGHFGWPVIDRPIEDMIGMGAEYMVIENPTKSDFDGFGRTYKHIASSSSFLILKLK